MDSHGAKRVMQIRRLLSFSVKKIVRLEEGRNSTPLGAQESVSRPPPMNWTNQFFISQDVFRDTALLHRVEKMSFVKVPFHIGEDKIGNVTIP